MGIDVEEAAQEYARVAAAASDKLVRRYVKTPDKLTKAASEQAQKLYEEAMKDPVVLKRRQLNLKKLTESELNAAMEQKGASAYASAVGAPTTLDKWKKDFAPYATEIDKITAALPARSRDATQNVMNRVVPLVKSLSELKKKIG